MAPTNSFEPSFSPTLTPANLCKNRPRFKFQGKDCDWVAIKPDARCNKKVKKRKKKKTIKKKFKFFCPGACNPRCSCRNSKKDIKLKDKTKKTKCFKVGLKNCDKLMTFRDGGKFHLVSDVCAKECGTCFDLS